MLGITAVVCDGRPFWKTREAMRKKHSHSCRNEDKDDVLPRHSKPTRNSTPGHE